MATNPGPVNHRALMGIPMRTEHGNWVLAGMSKSRVGVIQPGGRVSTMGALEYIIGGAAVLISAVSLALAISANQTQERLLAASTWPFLQFDTGNRGDDGTSIISLNLQNAGVGPARVRTVQVQYKGEFQSDARVLLEACCEGKGKVLNAITADPARVITAAETVLFLGLEQSSADPLIWRALNKERFKVRILACYCSVLGDCWRYDSLLSEPAIQAQCPAVPEATRWHG